jgi:hypothetical protein
MLSAREGAHPQFLSAVGPQSIKRGTCPWACAGGSANCECQRPGERIAATIAPAGPVLDLVVGPWLWVEFRSCRCRGCVRANWRGRVPPLPAPHRRDQSNHLTAARLKKSREGAAREARCWLTWKMALDVLPCLRRLQVLSARSVRALQERSGCVSNYDKRVALPRRSGVLCFCGPCQTVTLLALKCALADSPGGGGTGKKWETTTSRFGVESLELKGNGRQHPAVLRVQGTEFCVQGGKCSGWEMGDKLQQAGPRSCSPSLPSPSLLCRASRSLTACRVGSWRSQVAACGGGKALFLMALGKWEKIAAQRRASESERARALTPNP